MKAAMKRIQRSTFQVYAHNNLLIQGLENYKQWTRYGSLDKCDQSVKKLHTACFTLISCN